MLRVTMQKTEETKTEFAFLNQPVKNSNENFKDYLSAKVTAPRKTNGQAKADKHREIQHPEQQDDKKTINPNQSTQALQTQQPQVNDEPDQKPDMEDLPDTFIPKLAHETGYMYQAVPVIVHPPDLVRQYIDQSKTQGDVVMSDAITGSVDNPLLAQEAQPIFTEQSPDFAKQTILLSTVSNKKEVNVNQNAKISNENFSQAQHRADPASIQHTAYQPVGDVFENNHMPQAVEEQTKGEGFNLNNTTAKSETPGDKKITVQYDFPEEFGEQESSGELVQKLPAEAEALTAARIYSGKENIITTAIGQDNIIHQVTNNIAAMVKEGNPKFTMELTPETLGKITVEMQYKEGRLELKISAESATTAKVLTEQITQLKNALTANQVDVQTIDVSSSPGFDLSFSNLSKGYQQTGTERDGSDHGRYRNSDYLNQDLNDQTLEYENVTGYYSRSQLLNYLV